MSWGREHQDGELRSGDFDDGILRGLGERKHGLAIPEGFRELRPGEKADEPGRVQILRDGRGGAGLYVDTRDQETRLRDHERMRRSGAILASRLGPDQAPLPFPTPSYEGDCGLDLATTEEVVIGPGESANVPCGVAVALPPGTFGWITGRSSTWVKWGLWVMPGIIDEGWRGELRTLVHYPWKPDSLSESGGAEAKVIPAGTRLAQLIVLPNLMAQLKLWRVLPDDLPSSDRGTQGFGSTG